MVLPDEGVVYQQGYCGIVSYPPAARKPTEPPYYCHCFIWIKAERLPLCRWQEHTALVDCWINGNCADQFRVHGPFQLTPATHCSTIDSSIDQRLNSMNLPGANGSCRRSLSRSYKLIHCRMTVFPRAPVGAHQSCCTGWCYAE